jgi:hypothetical protein
MSDNSFSDACKPSGERCPSGIFSSVGCFFRYLLRCPSIHECRNSTAQIFSAVRMSDTEFIKYMQTVIKIWFAYMLYKYQQCWSQGVLICLSFAAKTRMPAESACMKAPQITMQQIKHQGRSERRSDTKIPLTGEFIPSSGKPGRRKKR